MLCLGQTADNLTISHPVQALNTVLVVQGSSDLDVVSLNGSVTTYSVTTSGANIVSVSDLTVYSYTPGEDLVILAAGNINGWVQSPMSLKLIHQIQEELVDKLLWLPVLLLIICQ